MNNKDWKDILAEMKPLIKQKESGTKKPPTKATQKGK